MIGNWIEIAGEIEVLTPLHIGTGERRNAEGTNADVPVAAIARDHTLRPYLPGSSLKGVMRRLLADDALFGPDQIGAAQAARSGRLIVRNAWWVAGPPIAARVVADSSKTIVPDGGPDRSTFVAAHVAIDGTTGVAQTGLLFHEDMVLPGTRFALRLALFDRGMLGQVAELLRHLTAAHGVAFGAGTRTGDGRVRLVTDSVTQAAMPGGQAARMTIVDAPPPATATWTLVLTGAVPFLIHDDARLPVVSGPDRQPDNIQQYLQGFDGESARLTGSSLLGVLRAGFTDFAARHGLGQDQVDILFGTTDRRGRVGVRSIKIEQAGTEKTSMSVRIDRFSGATIDNALFGTEGRFGTGYRVALVVEDRKAVPGALANKADGHFRAYLDELEDCVWGGLMIGHATNRGFGWFKVEVT